MNNDKQDNAKQSMNSNYDIRIKSLFDQAKTVTADEAYTHRVMLSIRQKERKARLFRLTWFAVLLPFVWIMAPDLEGLVLSLNGFVEFTTGSVVSLLADLGQSPATWIIVIPLASYFLYERRHRFI